MRGRKPTEVAAREAFEEAGLLGTIVGKRPAGRYHYEKQLSPHHSILCEVRVYMFLVERQLEDWPEKTERETQWFEPSGACELVHEGGLAEILRRTIGSETGTSEAATSPVAAKYFGPNFRKIRKS
jgi:8-oxo-dGTP pyrophosphatase MutT (NUDIX family)